MKKNAKKEEYYVVEMQLTKDELEIMNYALSRLIEHDDKMTHYFKGMETGKLHKERMKNTIKMLQYMKSKLNYHFIFLSNSHGFPQQKVRGSK